MVTIELAPLASDSETTSTSDPNFLTWTVTLSETSLNVVTVDYRILSGSANGGASSVADDVYGTTPDSLVFNPGETSKTISYRINADRVDELDEAVVLEIFAAENAEISGGAPVLRSTGVVLDSDGGDNLTLFTQPVRVIEGDAGTSLAVFTLTLSQPAPQAFAVSYNTIDGTATAGEDYTATSGAISFAAGQRQAVVEVPILGDGAAEAPEFFTLNVDTPFPLAGSTDGIAEIIDDDTGPGGPRVNVTPLASDAENTSSSDLNFLTWTITLSEPSLNQVVVDYRLLSGSAAAGASSVADDVYGTTPTSITFTPGETSKTVRYRIQADGADELDEAVTLEIFEAANAVISGPGPVLRSTGIILDSNGTGNNLTLFTAPVRVIEGDSGQTEAVFELILSQPAPQAVTITYNTIDGTAKAGEDYVATSGAISFAAGQQSAVVTVPIFGDTVSETGEFFTLNVDTPFPLAASTDGIAEILDDDTGPGAPRVNVTPLASDAENTSTSDLNFLTWTISLSEASLNEVVVDYRLLSGSGAAGDSSIADDVYGTTPTSITFTPGETSKTVRYRIQADRADELDEAVVLEIFEATNAVLSGPGPVLRSTGVILDSDGGSNLTLFTEPVRVIEGDSGTSLAVFTLTLSQPAPQALTITYNTIDGTAKAGEDYTATSGAISFAEGQRQAVVEVPILGDGVAETPEFFTLNVDAPFPLAGSTDGIAEIIDDDTGGGSPSVNVTSLASDTENTSTSDLNDLTWTITLSEATLNEVVVEYRLLSGSANAGGSSTADDVYGTSPSSVTFAPGETSKTVSYRINADGANEFDEAVVFEIFEATNAVIAGPGPVLRSTGYVLDSSGGSNLTLFTEPVRVTEGDAGMSVAVFTLTLSQPATQALTISYNTIDGTATAGEDYTATSGTVNFAVGQRQAAVEVPIIGDGVAEAPEFFTLNVDAPFPLASSTDGIAEIIDDDTGVGAPSINVSPLASDAENTSTSDLNFLTWTITLSEASLNEVSVAYRLLSGSANAGASSFGDDVYGTSPTALTFAPGETSKTITYRINADRVDELDEAVTLELFEATNGVLAGPGPVLRSTGVVLDSDGTGNNLTLFTAPVRVTEGDSGQTEAVFELILSQPAPQALTVNYATIDGTATAGEDYAATSGAISFAPGQQVAVVKVPVFGDALSEEGEFFTLDVDTPFPLARSTDGIAEILDDDTGGAAPSVNVSPLATDEENTSTSDVNFLTWTISLSEPSLSQVSVSYRLLSGTATAGASSSANDAYGVIPSTVTFNPGETSKTISYRINADRFDELDEAVTLELFEATNAVLSGPGPVLRSTGVILDSDGTGNNLTLFTAPVQVIEGDTGQTEAVFELILSQPATQAVTIAYNTVDGSATAGQDYVATSGSIDFAEGQRVAVVTVPVLGDRSDEPLETFSLNVDTPFPLAASSDGVAEIIDDDLPLTPPIVTGPTRYEINENATFVATITATDAADAVGDGLTFGLSGGADAGLFTINAQTGALSFISAPDFEAARSNNYDVTVRVTDRDGQFDDQALDIVVQDVDDTPPAPPSITGPTRFEVDENTTSVGTIIASDGEDAVGAGLTFALSGGADAGLFAINAQTGALSFRSPPDFEAARSNTYDVTVRVTDSDGLSDTQALDIVVQDVFEQPPAPPALSAPPADGAVVVENTTFVFDFNAEDADDEEGAGLAYSILGGTDAALFRIDPNFGLLSFIASPDHEAPDDEDRRNDYELTVRVTDDDGLFDDAKLTIAVIDEGPTEGDDNLNGTAGRDRIDGLGGRDRISGLADRDTLLGGDGNDVIRGGIDNDNLRGGDGDDVVRGQNGADRMFGNAGDDNLIGSIGEDTLKGGSGDDRLVGGGASDRLFGGTGNDTLNGLAGDDRLVGAAGDDVLTGGTGVDRFIFRQNAGDDTVLDFEDGVERMRIQSGAESFADLTVRAVGADVVIAFTGSTITLRDFKIEDLDGSDFLF